MNGRHPGRLLAPVALAACALALLVVVVSGGGEDDAAPAVSTPAPTATATPTPTPTEEPENTTYVVEPGDTPSSIAEAEDIDVQELLDANPDIDPAGLSVGQELVIP